MIDTDTSNEVFAAIAHRREERRRFLRVVGTSAVAAGGVSLLAACGDSNSGNNPSPAPVATMTPAPSTAQVDIDVLNFALNLEYLEAQFYSFATFGTGLSPASLTGTGTQGTVTGGKAVPFADPVIQQYAREITADEGTHVTFLRNTLGSAAVAMPNINIDGSATGSFTAAARAAGIVPATGTFDPYASDINFLLGAFIFEDVGVTAYKGASPLIVNKTYLEAAAGILAAEAYHAGLVRTLLYRQGIATPSVYTTVQQISDLRDGADGTSDLDQGITGANASISNIVPVDANSIVFSRSAAQVLNVVYLNKAMVTSGGFFPTGVNGNIKASAAN